VQDCPYWEVQEVVVPLASLSKGAVSTLKKKKRKMQSEKQKAKSYNGTVK
jgi:hypothetical protein